MTIGIHGSRARLYIGGLDMSYYVEQVDQTIERQTAEHTPLAAQTTNRAAGIRSVTLSMSGAAYVDDENAEHHWAEIQSAERVLYAFVPGGDLAGYAVYCGESMQGNHSITAPSNDIVRIPFGHLGTGRLDRGCIIRPMGVGGTSPSSSIDDGAGSDAGGACYVFCSDMGGTGPELTVTFQHSGDDLAWEPLAVMEVLDEPGALKLELMPTGARDIVGVDTVADELDIAGDWTQHFAPGVCFVVANSTGNDGVYTVDSSSYDDMADETTIAVTGSITDATVDGDAEIGGVEQYIRVIWTLDGTNPTATWFAAFARH